MKSSVFILVVALASLVSAHGDDAILLHVAPNGNDQNSGTSGAPFQTIERARDAIRKAKSGGSRGPFTVELHPGLYPVKSTITFDAQDSGAEGKPVTYRAAEPGTAVLTGAKIIEPAKFLPVTNPDMLARFGTGAQKHIVSIPLTENGILHGGPFPDSFEGRGGIFELFDQQGRMPISRWPNTDTTTMGKVLEVGDKNTPGIFEFRGEQPLHWLKNPNVWLKGQWRVGWEDPAIKVAAINPDSRTITFAAGISNGIGSKYKRPGGSGEEPWFAFNLPEEIDQPGEWAIDFATSTLYVWPRDPASPIILTQLDEPLIAVRDVTDIVFEGLTLQHSLGDGIVMEGVDRSLVAGCTVRNIAGRGIVVHGMHSGVQSCDVHDVGEGAIYISGGDRKSLTRSENFVLNNYLHDYGVLKNQYSAGVHVGVMANPAGKGAVRDAVGIRIAHNVLHHGPRDAFLYSGNDNVYEFNEVYYCGFNSKDTGAFYSWLDWTMRGNVIRYNYIHDTIGGVNPDDGAAGNMVYGNIFSGPRIGVWIASGPDNKILNNIFIKEEGSVFGMDDRGVSRGYASNPRLISRVKEINPAADPWHSAHPELATMLDNRPELPWRTEFVGNLIVSKKPEPSKLSMKSEFQSNPEILLEKDNLTVGDDPGFENAAEKNFRLKPEAEVFKKIPGFKPIPFESIGLYTDPYRKKLPTEEERKRSPKDSPYSEDKDKNFGT